MRPGVGETLLEAVGALICAGVIVSLAVFLFGCARGSKAPPAPADDAPVCIDGKCAVPGMR